jgi:EAL and modified HD-GYP domain-containing signal transduction protein
MGSISPATSAATTAADSRGLSGRQDSEGQAAVFVGRQPILDAQQRVFGYELLYRSGAQNYYTGTDGNQATCATVNNAMNIMGLTELVAGRRAFVNITRQLLIKEVYSVLPPGETVIELLESIEPDAAVCDACRDLKRAGYTLALDDFVFAPHFRPLLDEADLIKIDLTLTPPEEARELIATYGQHARFVAEKVETQAEFAAARDAGFSLFQGYFFARPEIVQGRDIPAGKQNYLLLLREISQPTLDVPRLERVIRAEPSLSVKLLRYINSAAFGIRNRVDSIRQAVLLLGERVFRKWASLVAVTCLSRGAPEQLMRNCLTRAEFCDQISTDLRLADRTFDLFLFGLLSGLEAIVRAPVGEIIKDLPLADDVRIALLGEGGPLREVYELFVALERVDTERVAEIVEQLDLPEARVRQAFEAAVRFADEALSG